MIWTKNKQLYAATLCRATGKPCPALAHMAEKLAQAMQAARPMTTDDFELDGSVELRHCIAGCTARYAASHDQIRVFGGTGHKADMTTLDRYADAMLRPDGSAFAAPAGPRPCAMIEIRGNAPEARARQAAAAPA